MELFSKGDIDKISYEILKGSKGLDVFPTPVEKIVSYANLFVHKDIDVSKIHTDYLAKAGSILRRALSKVRGLLDRSQKIIYLDLTQNNERKNFVKLHEVGHEVLPWQKRIHDILDDDDNSLSNDTNEEFEAEANYFASVTLFQHDRFLNELDKLGLSLESSFLLAKHFGASIHATLRRYVEYSKNKCALLVLEDVNRKTGRRKCGLRNQFQSKKFTDNIGQILLLGDLDSKYPFVMDFYTKRKFKKDGLVTLPTNTGVVQLNYQFFYNGYNAFVFLFPIGEKKSSRTQIILTSEVE